MTARTLYVPVLIETAEQAEALPVGTVATHSSGAGMDHAHKVGLGDHLARGWLSLSADVSDAAMVGWTALVPIEAEEEWGVEMSQDGEVTHVVPAISREHAEETFSNQEPGSARIVRRLPATPWEEA